jgi:hypothetical protein
MWTRNDFPLEQQEKIINEYLSTSSLNGILNTTHLTSFTVAKKFDDLIVEVLKFWIMLKRKFILQQDIMIHMYQLRYSRNLVRGEQISVENRLAAIFRTPPNKETAELIKKIVKSPRFDLKRLPDLPQSFMVVDGVQVVYDTVNFINPEQFTIAISKYDDAYRAQQFIEYFKMLSKDAITPELLVQKRTK